MPESATAPKCECRSCEQTIEPGEYRVPAPEGPQHRVCELREQLEDRYRFHISNPPHTKAYGFSLWQKTDTGEQPVIQNTGGLDIFQSTSTKVGNPIHPSVTFFDAIVISHHWLMCLMRGVDGEEIDTQIDLLYGEDQAPDHERWAIHMLVSHFHPPGRIIPELTDLREYVDRCTEWGTPKVMVEVTDG